MAYNFKLADIDRNATYNVALIDKWDGTPTQRQMTGEYLISFTQAAAHLYDIHAEKIKDNNLEIIDIMLNNLEYRKDRSAWDKGVNLYAIDLVEELRETLEYGAELPENPAELKSLLLNGAKDWAEYSWGGCSRIYDEDIAERLCTPSELKKTRGGERRPNSYEEWLDVQARALLQACNRVTRLYAAVKRGDIK